MTDKTTTKNSKVTRVCSIICIIFMTCVVCYTLYQNYETKQILLSRVTTLDSDEYTKLWVIEDLRLLLSIKDENSYNTAKEKMHLTNDLRTKLLGNTYEDNKHRFINGDTVSFIDAQYTLVNDGKVFYVLSDVHSDTDVYTVSMLVYIDNNLISNIIVY